MSRGDDRSVLPTCQQAANAPALPQGPHKATAAETQPDCRGGRARQGSRGPAVPLSWGLKPKPPSPSEAPGSCIVSDLKTASKPAYGYRRLVLEEKFCRLKPESTTHRRCLSHPSQHQRAPKYPLRTLGSLHKHFWNCAQPSGEERGSPGFKPKNESSKNKAEVFSVAE